MGNDKMERSRLKGLDADDAFIAPGTGTMECNGHVSAAEAARAHNIIWSTRRFRRRSGDDVGRRIALMKSLVETNGAAPVVAASVPKIPRSLRAAALAVAADVILVDGRMDRRETRFLQKLADDLGLDRDQSSAIADVLKTKNRI